MNSHNNYGNGSLQFIGGRRIIPTLQPNNVIHNSCTFEDQIKIMNSSNEYEIVRLISERNDFVIYLDHDKWTSLIAEHVIRTMGIVMIASIPNEIKTTEFYLTIFEFCKDIIEFIPKESITENMCMEAVANGVKLISIPKEFHSKELIQNAIKYQMPHLAHEFMYFVPEEYIDEPTVLIMIERGFDFDYIPKKFHSETIFKKALFVGLITFKDLPAEMINRELYLEFIDRCEIQRYCEIPDDVFDKGIVNRIENWMKNWLVLPNFTHGNYYGKSACDVFYKIPKKYLTYDLCREFVIKTDIDIRYIPKEFIDKEMVIDIICSEKRYYESIMNAFFDDDDVFDALIESISSPLIINTSLLNSDHRCLAFVKRFPEHFIKLPKHLINEDVYLQCIMRMPGFILNIPHEHITPKIALAVVRMHGKSLLNIPDELRTKEVCVAAVYQDVASLQHVPKELIDEVKSECGL